MASLINDKNGTRRIQFKHVDGGRKTIRLGKVTKKQGEEIKGHVEKLCTEKVTGMLHDATAVWLTRIDEQLKVKLVAADLLDGRAFSKIGEMVDDYLAKQKPLVKERTYSRMNQSRRYLVKHFGRDRRVNSVNKADALDYRRSLLACDLAESTTRKYCSDARTWFKYAVEADVIRTNPFAGDGIPTTVGGNKSRMYYVNADDAVKVMNELPSAEWRLMFALARWGGLRVPSEVHLLKWSDIDWAQETMNVFSPKNERFEDKARRIVPIFREIAGPLREAFEQCPPGEIYCVPFCGGRKTASFRYPLLRAIKAAGLTVWPKLWQNMRSTRETELNDYLPAHVVCAIIGNSPKVANEHYNQVTAEHMKRALSIDTLEKKTAGLPGELPGELPGAEVAQKAAQQVPARTGTGRKMNDDNGDNRHVTAGDDNPGFLRGALNNANPSSANPGNTTHLDEVDPDLTTSGGAKSGALLSERRLLTAWRSLTPQDRMQFLGAIEAQAALGAADCPVFQETRR